MSIAFTRRFVLLGGTALALRPAFAVSPAQPHQVVSVNLPDGRGYNLAYNPLAKEPPILAVLHPEGSDPRKLYEGSDFCTKAVEAGFAVLLPLGRERAAGQYGWDLDSCCQSDASEIDFIDTVVSDAEMRYGVNGEKLFLIGEAEGGTLALQYASQRPKALQAVAALDATFNPEANSVKGFVPVLLVQEESEGVLGLFARYAPVPLIAYEGAYYDANGHVHLWHLPVSDGWQHAEEILSFFKSGLS